MSPVDWSYALAAVLYVGLEYILGRTKRVAANSVLELLFNAVKAALSRRT